MSEVTDLERGPVLGVGVRDHHQVVLGAVAHTEDRPQRQLTAAVLKPDLRHLPQPKAASVMLSSVISHNHDGC